MTVNLHKQAGDLNANIISTDGDRLTFGKEAIKGTYKVYCKGVNINLFYCEVHYSVSWLDHAVATLNAHSLIGNVDIAYNCITSDHLLISVQINLKHMKLETDYADTKCKKQLCRTISR